MMDKKTQQHYNRMGQRFDIFGNKQKGEGKLDFAKNMINEHFSFYTNQGFSIEEAQILIETPSRVRDFFGLQICCDLRKKYLKGKSEDFFQGICDFLVQSDKKLDAFTLEALFEQMKHVKSPTETQEGVKNKIMSIFGESNTEKIHKIKRILGKLSMYYFENGGQSMSYDQIDNQSVVKKINEISGIDSETEDDSVFLA